MIFARDPKLIPLATSQYEIWRTLSGLAHSRDLPNFRFFPAAIAAVNRADQLLPDKVHFRWTGRGQPGAFLSGHEEYLEALNTLQIAEHFGLLLTDSTPFAWEVDNNGDPKHSPGVDLGAYPIERMFDACLWPVKGAGLIADGFDPTQLAMDYSFNVPRKSEEGLRSIVYKMANWECLQWWKRGGKPGEGEPDGLHYYINAAGYVVNARTRDLSGVSSIEARNVKSSIAIRHAIATNKPLRVGVVFSGNDVMSIDVLLSPEKRKDRAEEIRVAVTNLCNLTHIKGLLLWQKHSLQKKEWVEESVDVPVQVQPFYALPDDPFRHAVRTWENCGWKRLLGRKWESLGSDVDAHPNRTTNSPTQVAMQQHFAQIAWTEAQSTHDVQVGVVGEYDRMGPVGV